MTPAQKLAFRYQQKTQKKTLIAKLIQFLRDATGIGRGVAEDIASAVVRGRELARLALQKGWPVDEAGYVVGPKGRYPLANLPAQARLASADRFLDTSNGRPSV
jgi:hypothetical protein